MKQLIGFLSFGIAMAVLGRGNSAEAWKLDGVSDGVTVYTSRVQGSGVPRVRATADVSASTDEIWRYITGSRFKIKGLKEKTALGSCGSGCELSYVRLGHPLIKDRHYVAKFRTQIEEGHGGKRYYRTWREQNGRIPTSTDAVIVPMVAGSWTLVSIDEGRRTRLIYESHLDLGGDLPASFYARGFVKSAYAIVLNVIFFCARHTRYEGAASRTLRTSPDSAMPQPPSWI